MLLQGTLVDAADSDEAMQTVRDLRTQLASAVDGEVAVGGATATSIDTIAASIRDRTLIIPVVLVVITLILMVLLRSVVAPILLILTTVLSFGATMGVAALVFNGLLGFPGADPAVPLYGFVFLVALGIDYNIFLMTRVREESLRLGTTAGVKRGLAITGGVITSAGVVLAATFAALAVIPILFLVQLAFNALWSWLFFAWQMGAAALADIVLLWVLIVATIVLFWRVSRTAGLLLVPYLLWVGYATALTYAIWQRNPQMV